MASAAIAVPTWELVIPKELPEARESTGWRKRWQEQLKKIFEGHGENFFDGY